MIIRATLAVALLILVPSAVPAAGRALAADAGFSLSQAAPPAPSDLAVIDARLGTCSAVFTVRDGAGDPVYAATIHVRIRYGFLGVKRMDLEVGTGSDGRARVAGLPEKGKRLLYDIEKADRKASVEQDVSTDCTATHNVTLK